MECNVGMRTGVEVRVRCGWGRKGTEGRVEGWEQEQPRLTVGWFLQSTMRSPGAGHIHQYTMAAKARHGASRDGPPLLPILPPSLVPSIPLGALELVVSVSKLVRWLCTYGSSLDQQKWKNGMSWKEENE